MLDFLPADGMPFGMKAVATTRIGGVSAGRYASLNLGAHVGDDHVAVVENRRRLVQALELPTSPRWLKQVHGVNVTRFNATVPARPPVADAAVTRERGVALAVLTADCLPVLLAARDGSVIGAAHAGWRGLAAGVIEATLAAMGVPAGEVTAWLGPAIGRDHYEVGEEAHAAFAGSPGFEAAFMRSRQADHWYCDLVVLARGRLAVAGVGGITGGAWDTFADPERFYSYRRDGQTGRMATLIWRVDRYCSGP